jgi:ubiquinol-cytochrome c reductase cytochrome b subunit
MQCAICWNLLESNIDTKDISVENLPFLVKILYLDKNQQVTKRTLSSFLVGTSETIRTSDRFNEWLSGLIDGDGSLLVSKKGYISCEITVALKDEKV